MANVHLVISHLPETELIWQAELKRQMIPNLKDQDCRLQCPRLLLV